MPNQAATPKRIQVGQTHSKKIAITQELVAAFAKVSGDFNPIHLDSAFAARTVFKKPIAHGVLSVALLSGMMGEDFPGAGTILLETQMKYMKPIFVGDTATIEISVENIREDKPIATLLCKVMNGASELAAEGRTVVKLANPAT